MITLETYNLEEVKKAVITACVKAANEKGGLSQIEIGEMLGISNSSVSKYIADYNLNWVRPKAKISDASFDRFVEELRLRGLDIVPLKTTQNVTS